MKKASMLTFNELLEFVHEYEKFFRRKFPATKTRRMLGVMAKMTEETGELAAAILSSLGTQRSAKIKKFRSHHIDDELADVIITALVLAEAVGIDVRIGLERKIAKIKKRVKKF